jgi:tRNA pseudouridine38-40 synthase
MSERNIKLTLQYDGTHFHGWQRQPGVRTVQGELESALERIIREKVLTEGASRTDAGVHALGQTVNFHTGAGMEVRKLLGALNAVLPDDTAVCDIREVRSDFSSRFSAKGKIYQYLILDSPLPNPLLSHRVLHVSGQLNTEAMAAAAENMTGERDYGAFGTKTAPEDNTVCNIGSLSIGRATWPTLCNQSTPIVKIEVRGDRFLYKMVRAIAGTLVEVGRGKLPPERISDIIESRDRGKAGPTLKPHGLYLVEVLY